MKISALEHLACLQCYSALTLEPGYTMDPDHAQEIYTGMLLCPSCKHRYAVLRGVPRLVDETKSSPTDINTGHSFAQAWKQFPGMDERYKQQFYDWVFPVGPDFLKDKLVLECGCGKGRHARLLQEAGVEAIYGVDIGEAIDVAYKNVGHLPAIHLVQADIEHLPFNRVFDYAFSVGVLHHMEFPVKGFISMSEKIVQGGSVTAWVYGRENNWWLIRIVNPIRKSITSRMPSSVLLVLSGLLAFPLMLYCKLLAAPWEQARSYLPNLPPLYYGAYLAYIARFGFTEIHHIVFDHLIAPVANYVSQDYFSKWFAEAGWTDPVIRWHNGNSWSGFSSGNAEVLAKMTDKVRQAVLPNLPGSGALAHPDRSDD